MLHSLLLRHRPTGLFALPRFVGLAALAASLLGLLPGCSNDDDDDVAVPTEQPGPARISVPQAGLSPEGVQYDAGNKRFLVSSRTRGTISTVRDDSAYAVLTTDPRLISTIGLHLDAGRQRLLVAVADNGANAALTTAATLRKLAALAIVNPATGAVLSYVDLGALRPGLNHFANDIAVDAQGNAYITDSLSPIIYKVDLQGVATVFLEDPRLSGGTGFGLNGLVFHPDGYLLVAKANDGALFKVPVSNPTSFTTVTSAQSLTGADGLVMLDPQTLLVVSGSQRTVFRLNSTDGWATTRSTGSFATGATSPTTIARRGPTDAYVLYPYTATSPRFAIVKVGF